MSWRTQPPVAVDGELLYFEDRADAGVRLARLLEHLREERPVVLGLPRGGVPVAAEVAGYLDAPLDVIVVRKLGVPWQPELAMGAIGEGEVRVLNRGVVEALDVPESEIQRVEADEREELRRRVDAFRSHRPRQDVSGRTVLIVDDGIATGSTARAACEVAREQGAARIVVATPVASPEAARSLSECSDQLVSLGTPEAFGAIGVFYRDFSQTSDNEVRRLLSAAAG